MEGSPGILHHHLDAIDFDGNGGMLLAASSLTNRYWVGSLFYFKDPEKAPDIAECSALIQLEAGVADIKAIQQSNKFVCATDTGSVQLWEITEDETTKQSIMMCMAEPVEHDDYVTSLSVSADRTKVISSSQDSRVKLWDLEEFISTHTFKGHSSTVNMAACHPTDPNVFLSCSQDGTMLLWDTRKAKPATYIENQFLPSAPTCVGWQPGSEHSIAIGTETGEVLLQDSRKGVGEPIITKLHNRTVNKLAFAPHRSDLLATVSDDCTAAVLQYGGEKQPNIIKPLTSHTDFAKGLAWHPINHKLFTCGWDAKVKNSTIQSEQVLLNESGLNVPDTDKLLQDIKCGNKIEQMEVIEGASVET